MAQASLRFDFGDDGRLVCGGPADMSITYVGRRIDRRSAEADARRRFEEWQRQASQFSRHLSRTQVIIA